MTPLVYLRFTQANCAERLGYNHGIADFVAQQTAKRTPLRRTEDALAIN